MGRFYVIVIRFFYIHRFYFLDNRLLIKGWLFNYLVLSLIIVNFVFIKKNCSFLTFIAAMAIFLLNVLLNTMHALARVFVTAQFTCCGNEKLQINSFIGKCIEEAGYKQVKNWFVFRDVVSFEIGINYCGTPDGNYLADETRLFSCSCTTTCDHLRDLNVRHVINYNDIKRSIVFKPNTKGRKKWRK